MSGTTTASLFKQVEAYVTEYLGWVRLQGRRDEGRNAARQRDDPE